MSNLATLSNLHPDIIDDFMLTGKSSAIPIDLQHFIKQLQWSVEIWETERNISRAAKELRKRAIATQQLPLSLAACKKRIYSALEYFNVDVNVPEKIWNLDAADKLEDLAKVNIKLRNTREARLCYLAAAEKRKEASIGINTEDLQPPMFLISPNLKAEDLGFQDKNKKEIARKANEGFYIKLINELPIEKTQQKKLLTDADIHDLEPNEDDVYE